MSDESKVERRRFLKGMGLAAGGLAAGTPSRSAGAQESAPSSPGRVMRRLLERPRPLMCPGGYDLLSARLIQQTGFEAMVVGGSACAASMYGLPDYGLVSITELIELAGRIASSVDIPVLADADDGGGSPLNVYRAVRGFEQGGLAAVMIEDHVQVKHVGGPGQLISTEAMQDKIKAAVDARSDEGLIILARADSVSVGESADRAIARGVAYAEAGADMIFFAGMELAACRRAAEAVARPLMTTVSDTPLAELQENRIRLAVYASQALRLALGAAHRGLEELKATARVENFSSRALPGDLYQQLIASDRERRRARRYRLVSE